MFYNELLHEIYSLHVDFQCIPVISLWMMDLMHVKYYQFIDELCLFDTWSWAGCKNSGCQDSNIFIWNNQNDICRLSYRKYESLASSPVSSPSRWAVMTTHTGPPCGCAAGWSPPCTDRTGRRRTPGSLWRSPCRAWSRWPSGAGTRTARWWSAIETIKLVLIYNKLLTGENM